MNDTLDFDADRVRDLGTELGAAASDVGALPVKGKYQQVATDLPDSVAAARCEPAATIAEYALRQVSQALYDMGVGAAQAVSAVTGVEESSAAELKAAGGIR